MWCLFARDPGQLIGRKISWPRSDPHNHRPDYPLLLGDHGAAHRILVATMPSMRSVLLPLAGLRLPAGSWATATFEAIQRVTGLPPWPSVLETISFSSSRVGAAMERKPWRNSIMVAPSSCRRSAMWVAFQGS